MEKMRGREDSMAATKGNTEVVTKRDVFEKNEKGEPREDRNQEERENVIRKKEGIPSAVDLSNQRFDPPPIFLSNRNSQPYH